MQQHFTIFVVVQIFAHSALGCCSHHEHTGADHSGDVPSASAKVCGGNSHCDSTDHHTGQNQEDRHEGQESNLPCDGTRECEGESCYAIRSISTPDEQPLDSHVCLWQIMQPMPAELKFASAANVTFRRSIDEASAPVRAHLLFQILLI